MTTLMRSGSIAHFPLVCVLMASVLLQRLGFPFPLPVLFLAPHRDLIRAEP